LESCAAFRRYFGVLEPPAIEKVIFLLGNGVEMGSELISLRTKVRVYFSKISPPSWPLHSHCTATVPK